MEIFVEAMGHVNFDPVMSDDRKGIYDKVKFNGADLSYWTLHRLPLEHFIENLVEKDEQ